MNRVAQDTIKKLGLEGLPPEQQEKLMVALGDTIMQAVVVRGLEMLTEEQKDALDVALKKNSGGIDPIMDFLQSSLPDFEKIVSEEAERVINRAANLTAGK